MGIRTTQNFGLSPAARELVDDGLLAIENGETYAGYFGEDYSLHDYVPVAGEVARLDAEVQRLELALSRAISARDTAARKLEPRYREYVQDVVYSSGACTFLALRDAESGEPVQASLWPAEEIENA